MTERRGPGGPGRGDHHDDRALDRLADRGPSRVGVNGAMRVRDVSRPTDDDLAEAERTVVLRRARTLER